MSILILWTHLTKKIYLTMLRSRSNWLFRFTSDAIGSCAFGIDCESLKNFQAKFQTMGRKIFDRPSFFVLKGFCIVMSRKFAKFVGFKTTHPEVYKLFLNVVKETIQIKNHGEIEG